jgi:prepilin-type N-terminal cleavage/methylation domain-containing protein
MFSTIRRQRGFTIVEMLVVVSIIAVLAGMLLPAVGKATRTARKSRENNRLRQVGVAWNLYSNANDGGALPGFLPEDVQARWKVHYRLPDSGAAPGGGGPIGKVPSEDAQSWPWRLMPYLDFSQDVVLGYQDLAEMTQLKMSEFSTDPNTLERGEVIARQPAFGYNALYVGGWWEMVDIEGQLRPRVRFHDAAPLDASGSPIMVTVQDPVQGPIQVEYNTNMVAMGPSAIRNTEELVLFCSSAEFLADQEIRRVDDFEIGSHYVAPPIVENDRMWGIATARVSAGVIQVFEDLMAEGTSVPIGRYTGQVSVLRADGHTDAQSPGTLDDQRLWINTADHRNYTHQPPS